MLFVIVQSTIYFQTMSSSTFNKQKRNPLTASRGMPVRSFSYLIWYDIKGNYMYFEFYHEKDFVEYSICLWSDRNISCIKPRLAMNSDTSLWVLVSVFTYSYKYLYIADLHIIVSIEGSVVNHSSPNRKAMENVWIRNLGKKKKFYGLKNILI